MKWGLLIWVLACLGIELLLQSWIRQELFTLTYRFTREPGCALRLFSLLMFPGTLMHESSHFVSAILLGSHISEVSLKPKYLESESRVELGSVTARDAGTIRNSIISIAPTIAGGSVILLVGWLIFDFPVVAETLEAGQWGQAMRHLASTFGSVWGWIGAYVIAVASVNMVPSSVDLESAVGLILLPIILLVPLSILYLTRSPVFALIVENLNSILGWLSFILTFTILLSIPVLFFLKLFTGGARPRA